jgi:hypothetical protein
MAKAVFHKSQRVYVKSIGTWAQIEQIKPKWAQGIDEPIKIYYDVGMGRPFMADELEAEDIAVGRQAASEGEWRILRGQNKWRSAEECQHHPFPGTHPIVATGDLDWGGWRVPGTEYDRDPNRVEQQAHLISKAPVMAGLLSDLVHLCDEIGDDLPSSVQDLSVRARKQLIDAGIEIGIPSPDGETDRHAVENKHTGQTPTSQQVAFASSKDSSELHPVVGGKTNEIPIHTGQPVATSSIGEPITTPNLPYAGGEAAVS